MTWIKVTGAWRLKESADAEHVYGMLMADEDNDEARWTYLLSEKVPNPVFGAKKACASTPASDSDVNEEEVEAEAASKGKAKNGKRTPSVSSSESSDDGGDSDSDHDRRGDDGHQAKSSRKRVRNEPVTRVAAAEAVEGETKQPEPKRTKA